MDDSVMKLEDEADPHTELEEVEQELSQVSKHT
jgi:hypothetical protein